MTTVGVIAFCLGLTAGRRLLRRHSLRQSFWPLAIVLGLSPLAYIYMTSTEPTSLWVISLCTFLAQFCFGMGLFAGRLPIQYISGERDGSVLRFGSGWIARLCGYHCFFIIDALTAPLGWLVAYIAMKRFPMAFREESAEAAPGKESGKED